MTAFKININGEILPESRSGLSVQNRAYKFGDSLFETLRVANGKILFLEDHFSRLAKGMKVLGFTTPVYWDQAYVKKEIQKLLSENDLVKGGRIRLTLFRKGEGLYTPVSNDFGFVIEAKPGESNSFILNEKGIILGVYDKIRRTPNILSPLKTNNCLPNILAGLEARNLGCDDVLLLNDKGMIAESTNSNVFMFINGIVYTPALSEGCVAGVMRKKVIQLSKKQNIPVIETSVSLSLLNDAEEVFLTNAINGLQWVSAFEKKRYFHRLSEKLLTELNKLI